MAWPPDPYRSDLRCLHGPLRETESTVHQRPGRAVAPTLAPLRLIGLITASPRVSHSGQLG